VKGKRSEKPKGKETSNTYTITIWEWRGSLVFKMGLDPYNKRMSSGSWLRSQTVGFKRTKGALRRRLRKESFSVTSLELIDALLSVAREATRGGLKWIQGALTNDV